MFNFNFQDLNYFNVDNIKNIFLPSKISHLNGKFNISLEYDKNKILSKKNQEFNLKYISFRKDMLTLMEVDNKIEKDICFLEMKDKEFENSIF